MQGSANTLISNHLSNDLLTIPCLQFALMEVQGTHNQTQRRASARASPDSLLDTNGGIEVEDAAESDAHIANQRLSGD